MTASRACAFATTAICTSTTRSAVFGRSCNVVMLPAPPAAGIGLSLNGEVPRRGRKARARSFLCLLCLGFPVARRGLGVQRGQQPACGVANLRHRPIEGFGIRLRRLGEARELANEL